MVCPRVEIEPSVARVELGDFCDVDVRWFSPDSRSMRGLSLPLLVGVWP